MQPPDQDDLSAGVTFNRIMGGALRPEQLQQLEAAAKSARYDLSELVRTHPDCLQQLCQPAAPALPFVTASAAARLVTKLANGPATNKDVFAQHPQAISVLVSSLSSSALGTQAATALATLAEGHPVNQELIGKRSRVFSSLVGLLKQSSSQEAAVKALARLSASGGKNRSAIGAEPGAIKCLVALLSGPTITAQYAAAALRNITTGQPSNQAAVADSPGAMAKIVGLLGSTAFQVQVGAAGVLRNLAAEDADRREAIGASKGAIPRLVQLLSSSKPVVQQAAAEVLRNLAIDSPSNQKLIVAQSAMFHLAALLGSQAAPKVQEAAAGALCNLVNDSPAHQEQLRKTRGALPALRALLLHSSNGIREAAGKVLRLLATDKPHVTLVVREQAETSPLAQEGSTSGEDAAADHAQEEPGSQTEHPVIKVDTSALASGACGLPGLVELLGSSDPAVQQAAATALWAVAHELPGGKLLVGATEGAVPRLVALLSSSSSSSGSCSSLLAVQQAAAEALESLVVETVNQGRIREVPGVMASLTQLLTTKCAGVQQAAAAVLRGIGAEVPPYEVSRATSIHHQHGSKSTSCRCICE